MPSLSLSLSSTSFWYALVSCVLCFVFCVYVVWTERWKKKMGDEMHRGCMHACRAPPFPLFSNEVILQTVFFLLLPWQRMNCTPNLACVVLVMYLGYTRAVSRVESMLFLLCLYVYACICVSVCLCDCVSVCRVQYLHSSVYPSIHPFI